MKFKPPTYSEGGERTTYRECTYTGICGRKRGYERTMSRKKRKSITVGKSEFTCKSCGGGMVVRKHGKDENEKLRRQIYFFKQWDYCVKCNRVYFDEEFKITTGRGSDWEEIQRQQQFIKSI